MQRNMFQRRLSVAQDSNADDSLGPLPDLKEVSNLKPIEGKLPLWSDFFEKNDIYTKDDISFQTYYTEPKPSDCKTPVIFIAHHGAGSSGLSFAPVCKSLVENASQESCGFLAFDARGHGGTKSETNVPFDLEDFVNDFVFIVGEFWDRMQFHNREMQPSIFLLGHSLGGSVLSTVVHQNRLASHILPSIKGLVMIDIVEDVAVKALGAMESFLQKRPSYFKSVYKAIEWHLQRGLVHNRQSATVTVPPLVRCSDDGTFKWVADLYSTKPFWDSWFTGLSSRFISIPGKVAKMLILANNDTLDKNLIIGQMQGKYQLVLFHSDSQDLSATLTTAIKTVGDANEIGHFIHEDVPHKVAVTLWDFVDRNDLNRQTDNPQRDLINRLNAKWGSKGNV